MATTYTRPAARMIAIAVLLVGAAGLALWRLRPAAPGPPPRPSALERGEITLLRLAGTPRERGLAHGRLLRTEIRASLQRTRPADPGSASFAMETCARQMLPEFPPHLREEIAGIAEGAGVSEGEIVYLNTRFELRAFGIAPGGTFAGAAGVSDGSVWRAFLPGDLHDHGAELLLVVHEGEGAPIALLALPGMVGGFLGVRGRVAVTLRPEESEGSTILTGLPWTVLVRIVAAGSGAGVALKATVCGTLYEWRPPRGPGALAISHAAAESRTLAESETRGMSGDLAASLRPVESGVEARIERRGEARRLTVTFGR